MKLILQFKLEFCTSYLGQSQSFEGDNSQLHANETILNKENKAYVNHGFKFHFSLKDSFFFSYHDRIKLTSIFLVTVNRNVIPDNRFRFISRSDYINKILPCLKLVYLLDSMLT